MRTVLRITWSLNAALLLGLATGCGDDPVRLTSVRGRVFYLHEPLRGGTIVFTPDEDRGGKGPSASAEIQADGTFHLATDKEAGAVSGWHRVTILANAPDGRALPPKYRDPELSG